MCSWHVTSSSAIDIAVCSRRSCVCVCCVASTWLWNLLYVYNTCHCTQTHNLQTIYSGQCLCVCGSSYSVLFSVWHIESSYLIPCVSTGLCVFVCVWGIPFTNLTLVQLDFRHARQCLPGKFGATQSTQNIPQVFTITNLIDLKDTLESRPHKLGHVNCKSFAYASA